MCTFKFGKQFSSSKYIVPKSSTTSVSTIDVILTPISPESENSTFNESYVKKRNEKNESSALEEYESMDETDFPPPPLPIAKANLSVDFISGSSSSLQKVFCCASSDGTGIRLTRPGSAVQIHGSGDDDENNCSDDDKNNKVGEVEYETQSTHPVNTPDDDFGAPDDAPTPSPRSPEQIEIIALDEDQTDSESLTAPLSKSKVAHGRFSPKTYDEMIKFVFTEHGIRVISDKEYVV